METNQFIEAQPVPSVTDAIFSVQTAPQVLSRRVRSTTKHHRLMCTANNTHLSSQWMSGSAHPATNHIVDTYLTLPS